MKGIILPGMEKIQLLFFSRSEYLGILAKTFKRIALTLSVIFGLLS